MGIVTSVPPTAPEFQTMRGAGVDSVRILISWPVIQPAANGAYDWSSADAQVSAAANNGLAVLPFLYGTPNWAADCTGIPADICERANPIQTSVGAAGYAALLRAAVARYGPGGSFWTDTTDAFNQPIAPITTWQIGNEANSAVFAPPRPSVGAYYQLLKASSDAIRSVDPNAKLMLAGLFGLPSKPGITLGKFLDRLYAKKGAKRLFDAVAVHPYSPTLRKLEVQLGLARESMVKNKDKKTPIFVTELGWGSAAPGSVPRPLGRLLKGAAGQASFLRRGYNLLISKRKQFKLKGAYWFTWKDSPAGSGGRCYLCESAGLLDASLQAKPAFSAYSRIAG